MTCYSCILLNKFLLVVAKMLGFSVICVMTCLGAAHVGVSVSLAYQPVAPSQETYSCFLREGVSFAVIGVIEPCTGTLIEGVQTSLRVAKAAGLQVEAFLNPCMPCMNGTAQASAVWDGVGDEVDFVWAGQYSGCANPSNNYDWNHQFGSSIVTALEKVGAKVGVNGEIWGYIMGNWDGLKNYPLWYSGNNQQNFKDFQDFGGWTKPLMKTMSREQLCNVTVSTLFRP